MNTKLRNIALAGVTVMGLAACSVPSTASDEILVHKGGGPFESQKPKGCIEPSTRSVESGGDNYFAYPTGQRSYDFTGAKGADSNPFSVVSKDNQTLTIAGTLAFNLNTDCKVLTAFHDKVGNKMKAYMEDGNTSEGWTRLLNLYIGRPLDSSLDRVAKLYTRDQLFSDPTIKDKVNVEVNDALKRLVNQQMDGNQEFFQNFSVLVSQPDPGDKYREILTNQQQVVAEAKASEAKAVADANALKAGADAQYQQKVSETKVAIQEAKAKKAEIDAFGSVKDYNNYLLIEKGLNPFQPTYGAGPLTAPAPAPAK